MEDHNSGLVESEEISDSFICCVCLDLLYKPIVLSCGHVSCFWCVHQSMDIFRESHCPICRNPYAHFPNICHLLHRLLQKMYPLAYKKREWQTLEEEKKMGYFSPQFDDNACYNSANQGLYCNENSACEESCPNIKQLDSGYQVQHGGDFKQVTGTVQDTSCGDIKQLESRSQVQDQCLIIPEKDPDENCKTAGTRTANEMSIPKEQHKGNFKQITMEDVLCGDIKQLESRSQVQDQCLIIPEKDLDENCKTAGTGTANEMNIPKEQHKGNFKQIAMEDVLCGDIKQLESRSQVQDQCLIIPEKDPDENCKTAGTETANEMNIPKEQHKGNFKQITMEDVLCAGCKQLLFRPMVLNCGHVYCESCLVVETSDKMNRCQVCQSLHPKGLLNVCLELNQFLEQCFPKEYAFRRDSAQLKKINFKDPSMIPNSKEGSKKARNGQWWRDPHVNAHIGVGCDYCGMYPIIGERYRCKDCVEKIGFDLCSGCYNTTSKLPGRFNQQHTPDHKFEIMPISFQNLIPMAVYGSTHLVIGNFSAENSEDDSSPHSLSGDAHENAEFSLVAPAPTPAPAPAPTSSGSGEDNDRANSGSTA
ncbi:E3 ubiquitin-protein ligase PRT1 [Cannabis sativa]|uniref:E3 ubiquitin-protein ligase PRT1 n=1 Tax=Cannabis sativa TaxID=3483 RepID=UPI0029CA9BF6|nr:E3 ubiquitin-protein ligase PRT1 [Cannabis sativa]XP_060970645.1 E3 ubiquitin-protein ligase PRT1 [Cannabis sativa]